MKNRIKQLRSALNFTQPEFAEYLTLDYTTISYWENTGNLPARRVQQICHKFGVNERWLTSGEGNMFVNGKPEFNQEENNLQNRIKTLRARLGVNQKQFAAALDVNNSTVTVWEREGKVPQKQLEKISETFGVDMDWLLNGDAKTVDGQEHTNDTDCNDTEGTTDSNNSTRTDSNETHREFALRNGCNELTAIIFERIFNLPNEKKDLFIKILFELTEQHTDEFKKICDVIQKEANYCQWSDKR